MAFVVSTVVVTSPLQAAPFAAIVMDGRTGEVLYEKNANTRLHPASLTKMMTLYIAFQEIQAGRVTLDTKVTVTKYSAAQPPSRLGLKPGQKIALRFLIRAAAIKSANDAASAIGDHISGDAASFAKRMTRTARQLGMDNTTFKNANGLTAEGHLSTAHDMNILGRHLFYDFPQYYHIFSRRTADAGIATVSNTNTRFLDNYEGADGIKTGYTGAAGFNLTASAHRGNKHIIATVFGGTSTANRNAKMSELMDIGFGKARNNVAEQPPQAAPLDDALVASLESGIDEIDAEGGAAKTVRVSGAVKTSPRPKARPTQIEVPEDVAIAMAEGIEGALAEATAPPAPEGTLEFQAEAMTAGSAVPATATPEEAAAVAAALAEAAVTETPVDQAIAVAEAPVEAAAEETTTLAANDAAAVVPVTEPGTLEAQAEALSAPLPETQVAEAAPAEIAVDPALAAMRPKARPEPLIVPQLAEAAVPFVPVPKPAVVAEASPELVVTDPGTEPATEGVATLLADVTAVETVAGATAAPPPAIALADAAAVVPMPRRQAPIFDAVQADAATEQQTPTEEQVVVVMSTSGGRHFGVHVGEFPSRYDAEKALLKTALAESATLNEGRRATTQSGGIWHASFMGLTEEQAELACRRLTARAIACETVGG